ncbi:MAG: hypothetical protein H6959_06140 [Chromatiaceae bacterium]|nr:hypothetical protein [Gammaproteobacteria bacterium]MCP5300406.1 hypothetical protein [Chromatiaceae bacterium]MCP5422478.1 hypothetical protein [Chromatiaceae bacterium]
MLTQFEMATGEWIESADNADAAVANLPVAITEPSLLPVAETIARIGADYRPAPALLAYAVGKLIRS